VSSVTVIDEWPSRSLMASGCAPWATRSATQVCCYPEPGESTAVAKALCARCLVRDECLDYALEREATKADAVGIWGGLSPKERRVVMWRIEHLTVMVASGPI
jgi:hypothetical protein